MRKATEIARFITALLIGVNAGVQIAMNIRKLAREEGEQQLTHNISVSEQNLSETPGDTRATRAQRGVS